LNLYLTTSGSQDVKYDFLPEGDFQSLNVDGGVINNEPFELTEQLLEERRKEEIKSIEEKHREDYKFKTSASEFDTVVLMVDPFPNDEDTLEDSFSPLKAWRYVLPKIISAMRGQLMLKDEEVRKAYLCNDYTRILISPVRTEKGEKKKFSIACGSFGGFGGFFSKKFREHDFYLGRRNCQRFLQHYFSVPISANNPIINFGYNGIADQFIYTDNEIQFLPVIPDIRVIKNVETGEYSIVKPSEEEESPYPQISLRYLMSLEEKVQKRVKCLMDNITNVQEVEKNKEEGIPVLKKIRKKSGLRKLSGIIVTPLTNAYINIGKRFAKGPLAQNFIDTVITDMYKRGLLKDDL
jgi:hypothetical protein